MFRHIEASLSKITKQFDGTAQGTSMIVLKTYAYHW